jgi:large subunit ribosomal protein L6e
LFEKKEKSTFKVDAKRIADQKAVDASIMASVKKVAHLKSYLGTSFSLKKGQAPHLLKF